MMLALALVLLPLLVGLVLRGLARGWPHRMIVGLTVGIVWCVAVIGRAVWRWLG